MSLHVGIMNTFGKINNGKKSHTIRKEKISIRWLVMRTDNSRLTKQISNHVYEDKNDNRWIQERHALNWDHRRLNLCQSKYSIAWSNTLTDSLCERRGARNIKESNFLLWAEEGRWQQNERMKSYWKTRTKYGIRSESEFDVVKSMAKIDRRVRKGIRVSSRKWYHMILFLWLKSVIVSNISFIFS